MPTTKDQVLTALEQARGSFISGGALALELSLSRNAVWKAVRQLQEQGCEIEAVTNRGYRLAAGSSVLSRQSIEPHLTVSGLRLEVEPIVTSTNTVLKQRAEAGEAEGLVLLAEEQTAGRGRRGHAFFSPRGTGLYLSLLLRPQLHASQSLCITTCAAVAVARAIEHCTGVPAQIKWVNDVFCAGRKVCGILTEASLDLENGGLHYAVLGIGVNVLPPADALPIALADVATSVLPDAPLTRDVRSELAAEILNCFMTDYPTITDKTYFEDYRRRSLLLGQPVSVLNGDSSRNAVALDLDDEFRLLVRYEDGTQAALSSGEVSVRPQPVGR